MPKRQPKPKLDRDTLGTAMRAAIQIATGDDQHLDAILRKIK